MYIDQSQKKIDYPGKLLVRCSLNVKMDVPHMFVRALTSLADLRYEASKQRLAIVKEHIFE